MSFYEKGNVRIRYEDTGSGFPLLIFPGGGHYSTIAWAKARVPAVPPDTQGHRRATPDRPSAYVGPPSTPWRAGGG